jgi:hypothetical protein
MSDPSTPSVADSASYNSHRFSHASIALIITSLFTFLVFVCLSIQKRPSRRARSTPSQSMANDKPSAKHKPKLWEVCLDEDLTRLDGAVHNWQVRPSTSPRTCLVTSTRTTAYHRMDELSFGAAATAAFCIIPTPATSDPNTSVVPPCTTPSPSPTNVSPDIARSSHA